MNKPCRDSYESFDEYLDALEEYDEYLIDRAEDEKLERMLERYECI